MQRQPDSLWALSGQRLEPRTYLVHSSGFEFPTPYSAFQHAIQTVMENHMSILFSGKKIRL